MSENADPPFYSLCNAAWSDLDAAQRLVEADPSIVHARNSIGETALHYLVVEDAWHVVPWLLDHGSEINTRNDFGQTPLMEAARLGYLGMCRFLVERGADLRLRDQQGNTAVAHAAEGQQAGILKMLLEQLDPTEDVNRLFDEWTARLVLKEGGTVAEVLRARGLIDPWEEGIAAAEGALRHYAIFTGGRGAHSVLYLLRAETPDAALLQFLQDQDSDLSFQTDGTVELKNGKATTFSYAHPLAYVEALYKTGGEWQIREVREEGWESACEEVFCGENAGDIDGYIERCLPVFRRSHPRSCAAAFVWYLQAGPLVTFYRRKGTLQISVLQRYVLDAARGHEVVPWSGGYQGPDGPVVAPLVGATVLSVGVQLPKRCHYCGYLLKFRPDPREESLATKEQKKLLTEAALAADDWTIYREGIAPYGTRQVWGIAYRCPGCGMLGGSHVPEYTQAEAEAVVSTGCRGSAGT